MKGFTFLLLSHRAQKGNKSCVFFVFVFLTYLAVSGLNCSRRSTKALEKEMATHSSVLAWRIPGTGEPDGLPSMGSHRVGHD